MHDRCKARSAPHRHLKTLAGPGLTVLATRRTAPPEGAEEEGVRVHSSDTATLRRLLPQAHAVLPTPATHAISTFLKAGESLFQPRFWTKTVFHALRGAQPLFHAFFSVKTLSGTLFAPPLKKPEAGPLAVSSATALVATDKVTLDSVIMPLPKAFYA